jgi:hypothetical protein
MVIVQAARWGAPRVLGTLDQLFGPNYQAGRPGNAHLTGMKRKTVDIDIRSSPGWSEKIDGWARPFRNECLRDCGPERATSGDR